MEIVINLNKFAKLANDFGGLRTDLHHLFLQLM